VLKYSKRKRRKEINEKLLVMNNFKKRCIQKVSFGCSQKTHSFCLWQRHDFELDKES